MTDFPEEQVSWFGPDTWSGKTSPEPSPAEAPRARTSRRSSKRSSKSRSREPLCVCVCRTEDGQNPGAITLTMAPGALLGEYTTRSFGESPREENVSRLSQILEDSAHPKYSLSARACQGILNRAERRGKELPPELKAALIAQAKTEPSVCKETKSTELIPQDATELDSVEGEHTPSPPLAGMPSSRQIGPTNRGYESGDKAETLRAGSHGAIPMVTTGAYNPWDSQSARVYPQDEPWHSLNANENGGQSRDAVLVFAQNQRDEVRDLNGVAGSLAAEPEEEACQSY